MEFLSSNTNTVREASYDKMSRWYDWLATPFERRYHQGAVSLLAPHPGETILDVGCGTGACLPLIAEAMGRSGKILGLDLSAGMVAKAVQRVAVAGLTDIVSVQRGGALAMPFKSESVDAILMVFTLELFSDEEIPKLLAECRRVLKSGGRMVVVSMARDAKNTWAQRVYEWVHKHWPQWVDCRPIAVESVMKHYGFSVKRLTSTGIGAYW